MKTINLTDADRHAFDLVVAKLAAIRADVEAQNPDWKANEWQFAYTVTTWFPTLIGRITMGRINRLVSLGLLESQPSDGHGPSIRVNPDYRRYL